ncbi:hypothetical protein AOL_s00088g38 [Orbilia oligospora ATCC 24927]|uniref:Uncharacterized protein n=1 Tax=Arthrobotrys oligospora (strain ATCC 24927 / CBS 115.81 / DSM 1491) TaxID=756982 RepID=G1XHS5_ARTOA|nr:hypothetical protein AOL_s00088g38 [Orbilia oligospora ATCC 24927]EGX47323.1 hypothetical protein AOL_s00088g38 [Orbilia oligospora ATCC 24927]
MSTTPGPAQHGSEPGPSRAQRQKPPYIPKPKTLKHSLSQPVIQEAFEVDYYLSRTGNWKHIKMSAVVKIFRVLFDMLESASEDKWLFVWLGGLVMRSWEKLPDWSEDPAPHPLDSSPWSRGSSSLSLSSAPSAQSASSEGAESINLKRERAEKKSHLGIDERK